MKVVFGVLVGLLTGALFLLLLSGLVMLCLGVAHATSGGIIPALGYWPTFWTALALRLTTAQVQNTNK